MVSKHSEIWYRFFIQDPDTDFYPARIPDPGVNKGPEHGSRIRNTDSLYPLCSDDTTMFLMVKNILCL